MNRIYLVRHGENHANLTKEFSHRIVDYPLTPKGRLQAEQTAQAFVDIQIDAIYSSPLKRAAETAGIIAARLKMEYKIIEDFREVNVGILEEQPPSAATWAEHNRIITDWYRGKAQARFPGGEDHITICRRMRRGIEQIVYERPDQDLMVVSHGGIFAFTIKHLCPQVDLDWLRSQESHNCSISEMLVERVNGQIEAKLVTWGAYDHLHGEAANLISGLPDNKTFSVSSQ